METHVVKKYSNRKLYDTFSRRYVTLDVIAELVREGHDVRVIDRGSGEDITAVTLSQILLDMERNRRSPIPEPVLVDLVKERGEQLINLLRASLSLPREIRQRAAGRIEESAHTLETRVDDVLSTGLRSVNIATADDVDMLERKIDALAARVDELARATQAAAARTRKRS